MSRQTTEDRYAGHRAVALRNAEDRLQPIAPAPLSLRAIAPEALASFDAVWRDCPDRRYPWPWREMAADYRRNEPTRFEVAVWSGDALCGLGLGKLRSSYCRADFFEGSPLPEHPLKGFIIPALLTVLLVYAKALQREQIRLIEPLPAMVPRYEALGFVLVNPKREAPYCWKAVP